MTILDKDCPDCVEFGLMEVLGEPTALDCESEGEARASLAPPPLLGVPPPPCDAVDKAAAEEASWEDDEDAMVLARAEDSSWFAGGCCPACEGENGKEVEDVEEARLAPCREDG